MNAPKCTKIRYRDKLAAKLALARTAHKDGSHRPKAERRVYRCPSCRGWHLTSQERAA
jgi:hypothetical protein